jgi:hypothetical protein
VNITVDDVMRLGPCYSREKVESLFGDRASVTQRDIAASAISADDRSWLLLRLAPREVWLPAVYRAAERAIRHACWALHSAGLQQRTIRGDRDAISNLLPGNQHHRA